ncbi:MAG: hypothetical protein LBC05_00385 [Endomicrobium sp.]|jgi:hypothetical protein|nr:hypothetical protein [Endomicrobium sp.]
MKFKDEVYLGPEISQLCLGRYDIVKLALSWIDIIKHDETCKKLTQAQLINKALNDIITNVATYEKIEETQKKVKKEVKLVDLEKTSA